MTTTLGDFLVPAREHITAATSYRGDLPGLAASDVIRGLSRVIMALAAYLGDLALPDGAEQLRPRDAASHAIGTRVALRHSALIFRQAAESPGGADPNATHPVAARLSAAAGHLTASRDLLQARRTPGPFSPPAELAGQFYWAAVAASPRVAAALLAEITGHAQALAPWAAQLSQAVSADAARLALHDATRWLYTAAGTADAWQRHRSLPPEDRRLLHGIPVPLLPPRRPPARPEPTADLSQGIAVTATRLRHAAINFAPRAFTSPAANSVSWRRHALATAIITHTSYLILRGLAQRAAELGASPELRQELDHAKAAAGQAWPQQRAVSRIWDTVTTGAGSDTDLTPVAVEIDDLVLRTGRLAYRNPSWAPGADRAARIRSPAGLAPTAQDLTTVIEAIHHAADTVTIIDAADRHAIGQAARGSRLYVPTWLLPEYTDASHRYIPCPAPRVREILATYNAAVQSAARLTMALDQVAILAGLPSAVLAAPRRDPQLPPSREPDAGYANPASTSPPQAGQLQKSPRDLRVTEPTMLTRAQLAHAAGADLLTDAVGKIRRRENLHSANPWRPPADRQQRAR